MPEIGDYVLATKYADGHSQDHWAIGFYKGVTHHGDRYDVVDGEGKLFRHNGFRRITKISKNRGAWLLSNKELIEMSRRSLYWWLRQPMKQKKPS